MIHAWGWPHDKAVEARKKIPGLGLVQYSPNYKYARMGDIAFVGGISDARKAAEWGWKWKLAVMGDEHNIRNVSPDAYSEAFREAEKILHEAGVKTSASAIGMEDREFDHEWIDGLTVGDYHGVNVRPVQLDAALRAMSKYPDRRWVVTLIPVRPVWFPLKYNTILAYLQQLFTRWPAQLEALQENPNVVATGVWCMHEGKLRTGEWQSWHGLVDRHGRLTKQGRAVKEVTET